MSRMGFLTQLKSKEVEICKGRTSQMIVKEKLSERAMGSGECIFKREE